MHCVPRWYCTMSGLLGVWFTSHYDRSELPLWKTACMSNIQKLSQIIVSSIKSASLARQICSLLKLKDDWWIEGGARPFSWCHQMGKNIFIGWKNMILPVILLTRKMGRAESDTILPYNQLIFILYEKCHFQWIWSLSDNLQRSK